MRLRRQLDIKTPITLQETPSYPPSKPTYPRPINPTQALPSRAPPFTSPNDKSMFLFLKMYSLYEIILFSNSTKF
jgi:hypothetical protein